MVVLSQTMHERIIEMQWTSKLAIYMHGTRPKFCSLACAACCMMFIAMQNLHKGVLRDDELYKQKLRERRMMQQAKE